MVMGSRLPHTPLGSSARLLYPTLVDLLTSRLPSVDMSSDVSLQLYRIVYSMK